MSQDIPADALQLDWQATEALCVTLADEIAASGQRFDVLLKLQRGGSFPGDILARRLNVTADKVLSAGITSYEHGVTQGNDKFREGQFPTGTDISGKRVLIVDEVCDSGRTLKHVVAKIKALGAESVAVAVLHYKPTKSVTELVPDFYVAETDQWIVYPWEPHEAFGVANDTPQASAATPVELTA